MGQEKHFGKRGIFCVSTKCKMYPIIGNTFKKPPYIDLKKNH